MGCQPCGNKSTSRIEIVIAGLQQAGKTVIFFKLTDHPHFNTPVPTMHPNSEVIHYHNKNIHLVDLPPPSPPPQAHSNPQLYPSQHLRGIIFVVDASDRSHLQ